MPRRATLALLLAPALLVLVGLFGGGLAVGVARSLGHSPVAGDLSLGLDAYRAVLADPRIRASFGLTLYIAAIATALSVVLGIAAAALLRGALRGRRLALFLFQVNLTIPHLVGAIGILYLVSQSGQFARLAHLAGLIARPGDFPALVFDPAAVAIVAQYVWKEVPFIGLVALANMQAVGPDLEAAARTLGAGRLRAFCSVMLPTILPGVLAAAALVFAFAFGAYEIPALLGASYPQTLPVLAWRRFTDVDLAARPEAMALGMLVALVSAAMIWAAMAFARRGRTRAA